VTMRAPTSRCSLMLSPEVFRSQNQTRHGCWKGHSVMTAIGKPKPAPEPIGWFKLRRMVRYSVSRILPCERCGDAESETVWRHAQTGVTRCLACGRG